MRLLWIPVALLLSTSGMLACAFATPRGTEDPSGEVVAVLARALHAMGGADVVDKITTLVVSADHVRTLPRGDVEVQTVTYFAFPLQVRHEIALEGKRVALVATRDGGVMVTPAGNVDLPPRGRLAAETPAMRNPLALLKARRARDVTFTSLGSERFDGVAVDLLEMRVGPHVTTLAFDESGRLVRQTYIAVPDDDIQGEVVIRYDDFRATGSGLVYPFAARAEVGGRTLSRSRVRDLRVNEKLDADLFPSPEGKAEEAGQVKPR